MEKQNSSQVKLISREGTRTEIKRKLMGNENRMRMKELRKEIKEGDNEMKRSKNDNSI